MLLHAGHKYNFLKTNFFGTTNWRCVNKSICSTSIILSENKEILKEVKYLYFPDLDHNKNNIEIFEKHFFKVDSEKQGQNFDQPLLEDEMLSPMEICSVPKENSVSSSLQIFKSEEKYF